MKKLALTVAIVLGMTCMGMAQGGLFQKGTTSDTYGTREIDNMPFVPTQHGMSGDQSATQDEAPVGSGIAVLTVLGAAYAIGKKRKD